MSKPITEGKMSSDKQQPNTDSGIIFLCTVCNVLQYPVTYICAAFYFPVRNDEDMKCTLLHITPSNKKQTTPGFIHCKDTL